MEVGWGSVSVHHGRGCAGGVHGAARAVVLHRQPINGAQKTYLYPNLYPDPYPNPYPWQ